MEKKSIYPFCCTVVIGNVSEVHSIFPSSQQLSREEKIANNMENSLELHPLHYRQNISQTGRIVAESKAQEIQIYGSQQSPDHSAGRCGEIYKQTAVLLQSAIKLFTSEGIKKGNKFRKNIILVILNIKNLGVLSIHPRCQSLRSVNHEHD